MVNEQGKLEAMSDVAYDLIAELSHCAEEVDTLDIYIEDCDREKAADLKKVFEHIREDEVRHCDMLRNLLKDHISRGKI
jgi:hypothetical protein